mmetsp:Transcript_46168/g.128472  ORF Transcript_46168/g.128472 Transcript_46168/m.128472 type:complete len:217 (+) Transcript_46168:221-871(+)
MSTPTPTGRLASRCLRNACGGSLCDGRAVPAVRRDAAVTETVARPQLLGASTATTWIRRSTPSSQLWYLSSWMRSFTSSAWDAWKGRIMVAAAAMRRVRAQGTQMALVSSPTAAASSSSAAATKPARTKRPLGPSSKIRRRIQPGRQAPALVSHAYSRCFSSSSRSSHRVPRRFVASSASACCSAKACCTLTYAYARRWPLVSRPCACRTPARTAP